MNAPARYAQSIWRYCADAIRRYRRLYAECLAAGDRVGAESAMLTMRSYRRAFKTQVPPC